MGARMVRKQLYISQEQNERLQAAARSEGRTEAEVMRDCLDQVLAEGASPGPSRAETWQRHVHFMRARLALEVPHGERTWRREDAYEERLSRYPRGH